MYSNTLNEDDVKFYDEYLSSHLDDDGEITRWSNEFDPNLELDPDFELIHDNLDAIIDDGSAQNGFSPESSDSGNHSPSTISSDCGFNSSSDPWTSHHYENGYSEEYANPPMQTSSPKKPIFINGTLNNNYIASKLTPVSVSVNHVNNATFSNTPTYYANALPSSSKVVMATRPVETITLVPATLASSGQLILSSAPTLKLAPIQKPVTQIQRPPPATPSTQNGDNGDVDDDDYRKKMEDRRLRNRAAAQASRNKKRQQMDTMKEQLDASEKECARLRVENEALRNRVVELEKENNLLLNPQNGILKHKKARAAAGVCLAMCALVVTFSGSFPTRDMTYTTSELQLSNALAMKESPEYIYFRRHGRSLAEVQDYDAMPDPPEQVVDNKTKICPPSFLNASEKIRLNNDINSWIDRHAEMDFVELMQGVRPFLIHNSPKADRRPQIQKPLSNSTGILKLSAEDRRKIRLERRNSKNEKPFSKRTILGRTVKAVKLDELNDTLNKQSDKNYELAVRSESDARLIEELAAAIKQRDDVLYMVTMKDYFLMPMIHRNATSSPKLSIIIPALHTGNSSSPNQIQMLQIDCVVSSTKTLNLPDALVSLFNRSDPN